MKAMCSKRLWRYVVISLIAAGPVGGFLFGLLNAGDPDPNPIGRLVYACLMAFATTVHAGTPPNTALGAGHSFNVWPHIAVGFFLTFGAFVCWELKRGNKGAGSPQSSLPVTS